MQTRYLCVLAACIVGGCSHHQEAAHSHASTSPRVERVERVEEHATGNEHVAVVTDARDPQLSADNTGVNERDRSEAALTPMDQGGSDADRDLVAQIRKAVVADDSLSFSAKNVKIITNAGRVTLRGAVNNTREKAAIEQIARSAAGPQRVTNELEVSN